MVANGRTWNKRREEAAGERAKTLNVCRRKVQEMAYAQAITTHTMNVRTNERWDMRVLGEGRGESMAE